ncbi:MAG TPA: hypothetical protein VLV87_11265 [Gammaproteobacteria bacterium]|nr:hypothetical protein [Gammaproteobacteria bacterium]
MELLDRYLNFIRMLLPRAKQRDIISELSEDLRAQIADQEAELGRPLHEPELEAILKQCGHPLLVAARYQSEQALIGQPFYPLYTFGLKLVQWVVFPLLLVGGAALALFHAHPFIALGDSIGDAITGAIYMVGLLTVAFVVLERLKIKLTFLEDWRPRDLPKLPAIPDQSLIPRAESFGAFVGCAGFLVWWTGLLHLPQTPKLVLLNGLPEAFFWPVVVLFVAEMAVHAVNLLLPWWTRKRAAARVLVDVYAVVLAAAILRVWPWLALRIPDLSAAKLTQVELLVNGCLYLAVLTTAFGYAVCLLKDLRRARGLPPFTKTLWTWLGWDSGH